MEEQLQKILKNKGALKNAHDQEMANYVREQNKK
jgi:hypothetical protein